MYKAKRKGDLKWVYGDLKICLGEFCVDGWPVIMDTVCQETKFIDDRGKHIFEGDKLNILYTGLSAEQYTMEEYIVKDATDKFTIDILTHADSIKITGNIYDDIDTDTYATKWKRNLMDKFLKVE